MRDVLRFMKEGESLVVSKRNVFNRPVRMEVRLDDYHINWTPPMEHFQNGEWKNEVIHKLVEVREKVGQRVKA